MRFACSSLVGGMLSGLILIILILINATHSEEHAFRSEKPSPIIIISHRRSYCVLLYLEKKTGSAVNSLQSCTHATCINCCCVGRLHVADCYGLVQANVICLLVSVVP